MALQTPVRDHEAFGDGLFRRSQQAFVEPDRVRAGDFVQAVSDFCRVESATQHLRSEHANAATDGAGGKYFLNHLIVVIDGDVEVLSVEGNAPGRAAQFTRPLEPNRTLLARGSFRFRQTTRGSFVLRFGASLSKHRRGRV